MPLPDRSRTDPYRLYLAIRVGTMFLATLAYTTSVVYWVDGAGLNPLQLLLLGTVLEVGYLLFQLPTGVLADLVSRRACIVAGFGVYACGLLAQGVFPVFAGLLAGQALIALGAALMSGAQESWAADETRRAEMTPVYLRATQLSFAGSIAGGLLSGVLASVALELPMLAAGVLMLLGTAALALLMPERHFTRRQGDGRIGTMLRHARAEVGEQARAARRVGRAVPGLALLFGTTFAFGVWTESFDRLAGAFLLEDIGFPDAFGLEPAMWLSLVACVVALAGIGVAEWARRRTARLGSRAIAGMLALFTAVTAAGVVGFGLAGAFPVAVGCMLLVSTARPLYEPMVNGWLVVRVEPKVRATALSVRDMFDSGGQIASGPVIGGVAGAVSIRAAILTGAAVLAPALLCLIALAGKERARTDEDAPVVAAER